MRIRLDRDWRELTDSGLDEVGAELGVYEIADAQGTVLYIGYAGGRSLFGLRGELRSRLQALGPGRRFRTEINMQYLSRWNELLAVHLADHGRLPELQGADRPARLGRISPSQ